MHPHEANLSIRYALFHNPIKPQVRKVPRTNLTRSSLKLKCLKMKLHNNILNLSFSLQTYWSEIAAIWQSWKVWTMESRSETPILTLAWP